MGQITHISKVDIGIRLQLCPGKINVIVIVIRERQGPKQLTDSFLNPLHRELVLAKTKQYNPSSHILRLSLVTPLYKSAVEHPATCCSTTSALFIRYSLALHSIHARYRSPRPQRTTTISECRQLISGLGFPVTERTNRNPGNVGLGLVS